MGVSCNNCCSAIVAFRGRYRFTEGYSLKTGDALQCPGKHQSSVLNEMQATGMRRVGTELHQQQLNTSVCRRPVMYRVFIWVGARRIQEVMEAKGYIIGTSQVRLCCFVK